MSAAIDVIATSVSGSISDWGKVKRIVPLFEKKGLDGVRLKETSSHLEARRETTASLTSGARTIISAGGSGTFNAVLEGCCDSGVPLRDIRLGFLRKGSADLIGKTLGMPDDIGAAIDVFARAITKSQTVPCDVLCATGGTNTAPERHFVGYGGAEIFGRIPHYTENRFMKWYKGLSSQIFGDLGPFTIGMMLALSERLIKSPFTKKRRWNVFADGREVATNQAYQAMIIVNGYLGPNLPFSSDPLGSGQFHLFAIRDMGVRKLLSQAVKTRSKSIMKDPEKWGMVHIPCSDSLTLEPTTRSTFPLNVDGSTMPCTKWATIRRADQIRVFAG